MVDSVSPQEGSIEGGTEIHIKGNFFDESVRKAKVFVGGKSQSHGHWSLYCVNDCLSH